MSLTLAVVDADVVPPAHETTLSASVDRRRPTVEEHRPARVVVRLRNESETHRGYRAGRGNRRVFSTWESEETDPGLALVTPDEARVVGEYDRYPAESRLDGYPHSGGTLEISGVTLEPDESMAVELEAWGHPDNADPRLPTGTFRFEETYSYAPWHGSGADGAESEGEERGSFEWGFSVRVGLTTAPTAAGGASRRTLRRRRRRARRRRPSRVGRRAGGGDSTGA